MEAFKGQVRAALAGGVYWEIRGLSVRSSVWSPLAASEVWVHTCLHVCTTDLATCTVVSAFLILHVEFVEPDE